MTEDFVIKYLWSAAGYGFMSIPILFPATKNIAKAVSVGQSRDVVASRTESMSCTLEAFGALLINRLHV